MRTARVFGFWFLVFGCACAHVSKGGSVESLKPAAETWHQRIRWRDYRGASELIVAERQEAFRAARAAMNDEKDLTVTDYQLEDAQILDGGFRARVVSRVSWMRLPSVSEKSELVTTELVWQGGVWRVARQENGPFAEELGEVYEWEPPDAGS